MAIRMVDDQGWICRNSLIHYKTNSLPGPFQDRLTNTYEPVYLFSKSNDILWYVNKEKLLIQREKPLGLKGKESFDWGWVDCPRCKAEDFSDTKIPSELAENVSSPRARKHRQSSQESCSRCEGTGRIRRSLWYSEKYYFDLDAIRVPTNIGNQRSRKAGVRKDEVDDSIANWCGNNGVRKYNPLGKNPGDVWSIPTQGFSGSHFAVFSERLIEPMVKAGCPRWICSNCNLPRVRVGTKGFAQCSCNTEFVKGLVLDPFSGVATTAVVARRFGRSYLGIELNPQYIKLAEERLAEVEVNSVDSTDKLKNADKKLIAKNLAEGDTDITQAEIAERLKVSQKTVSNWISDIRAKQVADRDSLINELFLLGRTQQEIANKVGLSQSRVAQIISNSK